METEQDSMEEEDMEIDHLENTDSNQQENIEIDQENIDSENTQPEKESVSTNKEHFQPGVFAAVLFPTKKGKSVTVCIGQILDIDDQEFQLKYMKKSGKTYIWPDKQDISWETDDKLVATVAEPTMSDKRSHFVFDSEELEDISKKVVKRLQICLFPLNR